MDEFEYVFVDEEDEEVESEDELKLAEVYKLAAKLLKLLEEIKSCELREAASLMLIKEIIGEDKILLGLASKMLQDMSFGYDDDESYVS
ncbi:MAG: hypothetical protein DRJ31_11190 [Candidatus Methanomethylicota archaeon]|uniref:Uncharacterized protein n=1 Tax=Thermoproteota archaeon TaxID=2056631 RepID=A0A497EJW6_9CREN|nr:MAG: hypothetical protein DRJ31_11190 [Candidatus Verstraetearchaeota archaeon]